MINPLNLDDDRPSLFFRGQPGYTPTPLAELPRLAERLGIERLYCKDESQRPLGSFKYLGGAYAGLKALVRYTRCVRIADLLNQPATRLSLPALLCASDGNHGLAVAWAAKLAGTIARVYLHAHVPESRTRRIEQMGAEIVRVSGTYDDSVDQAYEASRRGEGLLIADTSAQADDVVVNDVMNGYGFAGTEIASQLSKKGWPAPTHLFLQAGVGGWAAAIARSLKHEAGFTCQTIVVEPDSVACVGAALRSGKIKRLSGDLLTSAEMLSCGEASAPAFQVLRACGAIANAVSESQVLATPEVLQVCGGPATTPSGATGLAGALALAANPTLSPLTPLGPNSRILITVTEGPIMDDRELSDT
ncbi:MAG: pyridoxal-phosphate dependent enzyme [Pirellulales bacterium]